MARKNQIVEMNTFVSGLLTEASPLTFPANASLDEQNFELLKNGSRKRRLGMDLEAGYTLLDTTLDDSDYISLDHLDEAGGLAISSHVWKNVGGSPSREFIVIQVGSHIKMFDMSTTAISSSVIYSAQMTTLPYTSVIYSYANIDGYMVMTTQQSSLTYLFEFIDGNVSTTLINPKIRDFFGIDDVNYDDNGIVDGNKLSFRPKIIEVQSKHFYNLRNQGWGIPRKCLTDEDLKDPITHFFDVHNTMYADGRYPSMADRVVPFLYPDPNDPEDGISQRFMAKDAISNPIGSTPAPKGHFIINALYRGYGRNVAYNNLVSTYPDLDNRPVAFNNDYTIGGFGCIAAYSGRLFYSGINGPTDEPNSNSPNLSSYILFTKIIESKKDVEICYQEGDPTSSDAPDLLDTDGGYIKIDEAYGIKKLVNIGSSLLVVATNGIWSISGGSGYGFSATNILVRKITEHGCLSVRSVVLVEGTIMYWGDDGIYHVTKDQVGDPVVNSLTNTKIQSLIDDIDDLDKLSVSGIYDSYTKKVSWIYGNRLNQTNEVNELYLDLQLNAFYKHKIGNLTGGFPRVVHPIEVPPYRLSTVEESITYGGVQVQHNGEDVVLENSITITGIRESMYLVLTQTSPNFQYTFASYSNTDFKDWESFDSVGIDSPAYLYTGYMSGDVFMLNKEIPYITFYFERTEDGFEMSGGDMIPTKQSSCKVQAQWDWSDNIISGRWGTEFQAYRFNRHFIPAGVGSDFNYGHSVIHTKNKLRGRGKVLSLYIHTDPGKDCRLLGWSMLASGDGNV